MTTSTKKTVVITGCSDGGLGAALAIAYHKVGWRVFATARNVSKMSAVKEAGIETLALDVLSEASIAACINKVSQLTDGKLDCLINNAGAVYSMPVTDVSIVTGKKLFDVNFWSIYATTQAFLPLLLKSEHGAMIVNHTSIASVMYPPFQSVYNASKAAAAMLTQTMRLELAPLNIRVYDLKSGRVKSEIFNNAPLNAAPAVLPPNSLYTPAKDAIELAMDGWHIFRNPDDPPQAAEEWAIEVVEALEDPNTPFVIYKGKGVEMELPRTLLPPEVEEILKRMFAVSEFEETVRGQQGSIGGATKTNR